MKAETLSMVHVEQLAEGANPKYIEGLSEWDYEEVITELARDNLAAERAMKQANQAVLSASETIQKLVAENAALRSFGNKLDEMRNDLNGEGTGIQGKTEVAIQQVALEAAMEEFDAINTPATDAAIAEIKAQCVDELISLLDRMPLNDMSQFDVTSSVVEFAANLRAGRKG